MADLSDKKFLAVVDDDVVADIFIPGIEKFRDFQEAMLNGVTVVELDDTMKLNIGDTYVG